MVGDGVLSRFYVVFRNGGWYMTSLDCVLSRGEFLVSGGDG